jgi:flagellar biosynthesis/type III secretory pathway protein FliH
MRPLKLEVFDTGEKPATATVVMQGSDLDEARLAAYEQGFTAGWDDATAAASDDQSRMRTELGRNLQALSFTFHEARTHVLRALAPLLEEMAGRLLPELARASLAPLVLETLMPLAETLAETPVAIVLNPAARPAVEALLHEATGLPFTLREEPTLGEGQVYLRLGDSETRIDLDRATAEITAAVRGFYELTHQERKHG